MGTAWGSSMIVQRGARHHTSAVTQRKGTFLMKVPHILLLNEILFLTVIN